MALSAGEQQSGGNVVDADGRLVVAVENPGGGGAAGSVITGDTGQSAEGVAGVRKEVAFTTTIVQAVATTDCSNYRWLAIHITGQGTSSVVTLQVSNDNVNWVTASIQAPLVGNFTTSTSATGVFFAPVNARYVRLNVTGISAGTTAGVLELFSMPAGSLTQYVSQLPTQAALADAFANPTTTHTGADGFAFNGTTWDRARSTSAANLSAFSGVGGVMAGPPGNWAVVHTPATNVQATASRAAGGAGVRHVATSVTATLSAGAAAIAAASPLLVNLRDGATGAGTIVWSTYINVPAAAAQAFTVALSGLSIVGTAATAMTLEFAAAGGTNSFESASLTGYDVS